MKGKLHFFPLRDKSCLLYLPPQQAEPLPLVVALAGSSLAGELEAVMALVEPAVEEGLCAPFLLAAFAPADWNSEFTPWPAPGLQKNAPPFGGRAGETLAFVQEALIPYIEERFSVLPGPQGHMLLGYSLGGLTALWAAYRTDAFGAVASCSGSLWYDGWAEFMEKNHPAGPVSIYLSLGRDEEHTRSPRMKAVGPNTRTASWHCNQDARVVRHAYREQPGGHFDDIPQRLAEALLWLNKPTNRA